MSKQPFSLYHFLIIIDRKNVEDMALIFFPQPYPDEIIYSIIARYHHISGNYYNVDSMYDLFNTRQVVPSISLQTRLGILVNNAKHFGINFETVLFENTMFPYLTAFIQPENYARVYKWSEYTDNRSDRFATGALHKSIYPKWMMYCPDCYKDDIALFGEGYWHRIHQTPGIVVCNKHHRCLLPSTVPTFNHRISTYQLLNKKVMRMDSSSQQIEINHNVEIYNDTKFLYDNFKRVRTLFSSYNYCFRDAFLPKLIANQLATYRTLKTKEFEEAFIDFYGNDYLNKIGLRLSNSYNNRWPINLCREKVKHHTYALEYLLLSRFLFGSFENFINSIECRENFNIVFSSNNTKNCTNSNTRSQYRNRWLSIIKEEPNKGRYVIYQKYSGLYNWLHKYDDTWLKEHLPEKLPRNPRSNNIINWHERDNSLSEQINSLLESIKIVDGKPKRITAESIYKKLECKAMIINNRNRLPLTNLAIKNAIETIAQFRLRRCYWIITSLEKQGIQPTTTQVLYMLNPKNWMEWKCIVDDILQRRDMRQ